MLWSVPHGRCEYEETQREDDESGVEQRIEHGLDALPQQDERCLILGRCPGGLVEVGERGGREVGHGPGSEQDQTQDAQDRPEQRWGGASPAQTAVRGEGMEHPQEDCEVQRAMVAVLRDGAEPDLAPQPGVADIERLARDTGGRPGIDVHMSGALDDLKPSVGAALYRIAQESVTNATRHTRNASRVAVHVTDEGDLVRLTVSDDGDAGTTRHSVPGYGLLGMTERTSLLGGVLLAAPGPEGGWTVDAVLPKSGVSTTWPRAAKR